MRQDIYIGLNLTCKCIVDLLTKCGILIQTLVTLQELHTLGQVGFYGRIAAINIYLIYIFHARERLQQVGHQRTTTQLAQVLTLDTLAVKTYGNKCYSLHNHHCTNRLHPLTSAPDRRPSTINAPSS